MPSVWLRIIEPSASVHLDLREIRYPKWPAPSKAVVPLELATPQQYARSLRKVLSASVLRFLWATRSQVAVVQMVSARMETPIAQPIPSAPEEYAKIPATTLADRMLSARLSIGNPSAVVPCDSSLSLTLPRMDVPGPYLNVSLMSTAEERCATMDNVVLLAGTAKIALMARAA